jgi:glycerate-2-kinase
MLLTMANGTRAEDLILWCFTGGSSALACFPPVGVTLAEVAHLNTLLLRSGAEITEINTVRKHVSRIKGGRLAATIKAPKRSVNLTVSDVTGGQLDAITDPTVQDTTTVADAIDVLLDHRLWRAVAPSIRAHLRDRERAESPRLREEPATLMLVDGQRVVDSMVIAARRHGLRPIVLDPPPAGEAVTVGTTIARTVCDAGSHEPCAVLACGGESTVKLSSDARLGGGGPNQEAALAASRALAGKRGVAAIFLDTDGIDGGSQYAGGIVDGQTLPRVRASGQNLDSLLARNTSTAGLVACGDAVRLGHTETNVNDLIVAVSLPNLGDASSA